MIIEDGLASTLARTPDRSSNNEMIQQLQKDVVLKELQDSDRPLEDATIQMLTAAQGPSKLFYLSPEITLANRVSNAVTTRNPYKVTGLPTQEELSGLAANAAIRDKVLWKVTGNGIKANGWSNTTNGGNR